MGVQACRRREGQEVAQGRLTSIIDTTDGRSNAPYLFFQEELMKKIVLKQISDNGSNGVRSDRAAQHD